MRCKTAARKSFLLALTGVVLLVQSCGEATRDGSKAQTGKPSLSVAFVYVGPVGDGGWTYAHDQARRQIEKEFPNVTTSFLESVPEGADAERVITQFAQRGAKVIFTTSFGYMDPTIAAAEKFPGTVFLHCSGYKRAKNVGTYFGHIEQPSYLSGLVAGSMTKKGIAGFVAPHPIPEVIRNINAFALGFRKNRPNGQVRVVWTNSWNDPGKEKEAAVSLIEAGCDLIASGVDSAAPLQAAQERGCLAFGYDFDSRKVAPKAFLTAPVWDWYVYYKTVIESVMKGTWKSEEVWWGMETGLVKLAPYSDLVPKEVQAQVDRAADEIKKGSLKVFAGPVLKQDGSTVVPAGKVATDPELLSMSYFVQGVVGTIPSAKH